MPQDFYLALCFLAAMGTVCVLANSSVGAPAKNTPVAPPSKQGPVRTDLTPRNKNECLAVARTLREQATKLFGRPNGASRES